MKIKIKDGLLRDANSNEVIGLPLADWIAQAQGFMYVERMVDAWDGHTVEIGEDLIVMHTTPCPNCPEIPGQQPVQGGPCKVCKGSGKMVPK